ncbi:MAG: hypothetical protein AAF404_06940 [Pseudomonadota bacterium]
MAAEHTSSDRPANHTGWESKRMIVLFCVAMPMVAALPAIARLDTPPTLVQSLLERINKVGLIRPQPASNNEFNIAHIAHITLTDQDGKSLRPDRLTADATLLNFMFTGCSTEYPRQTA